MRAAAALAAAALPAHISGLFGGLPLQPGGGGGGGGGIGALLPPGGGSCPGDNGLINIGNNQVGNLNSGMLITGGGNCTGKCTDAEQKICEDNDCWNGTRSCFGRPDNAPANVCYQSEPASDPALDNVSGTFTEGEANCVSSAGGAFCGDCAPPTPSPGSTGGDPITEYKGKKTQFYLPTGQFVSLIKHQDVELLGKVKGVPGDELQQHFDGLKVWSRGREVVLVHTGDPAPLVPTYANFRRMLQSDPKFHQKGSAAAAAGRAKPGADVTVSASRRDASGAEVGSHPLKTLTVTVDGRAEGRTGVTTNAGGGWLLGGGNINVTVLRDPAGSRVGLVAAEQVRVDAPGLGVTITTSVARKFTRDEDRVLNMHLDVAFSRVNVSACTGVLPELWGVRPMSPTTAQMLVPPEAKRRHTGGEDALE